MDRPQPPPPVRHNDLPEDPRPVSGQQAAGARVGRDNAEVRSHARFTSQGRSGGCQAGQLTYLPAMRMGL